MPSPHKYSAGYIFYVCSFLFLIFLFESGIPAYAQTAASNIGTDFWTTYADHINGATGNAASKMSLYISAKEQTNGTIALADGSYTASFSVAPNQVTVVAVPASAFLGNNNGIAKKGVHITSTRPVAVYGHIYANDVSGASLILPVNALGNEYYSINYKQLSNASPSYSLFTVIATEDQTVVQITPAATLIDGSAANTSFKINLNKGDVYQGLSASDLTGTHINSISENGVSCKRIAVYSGSNKIYIGSPNKTSDNLFQQCYPVSAWGNRFITAPLKSRNFDVFRIAVSDPATNLTVNGSPITPDKFVGGFYYEFSSQIPNVIISDKPIQVAQYAVTEGNSIAGTIISGDVGDPDMIFLTPLEQTLNSIALYSTNNYLITKSFINVIIPTVSAASFKLDTVSATGSFLPVPGAPQYSYAQIDVATGSTHLLTADSGFNAIAYGFGSRESYGYAAGAEIKNLHERVTFSSSSSGKDVSSSCDGSPVVPEVSLPFQTTSITWSSPSLSAPVTQKNPAYRRTFTENNVTYYVYTYPVPLSLPPGVHTLTATVFNPVATLCGADEALTAELTVLDKPKADFTTADTACTGSSNKFTLTNSAAGETYQWDFGDGSHSAEANPAHTYTKAGDYTVTLTATNTSGCSLATSPKTVHVIDPGTAHISYSSLNCAGTKIDFVPVKSSAGAKFWIWNYGDGTKPDTTYTPAKVSHAYANAGEYQISLQVANAKGCLGEPVLQKLTVHENPVADFEVPDVCLYDAKATFTYKPSGSAIAASDLTFAWNFGDGNATASNPNTAASGSATHHYTQTGEYTVTLTVTSSYGCVSAVAKKFIVNGSHPKAGFEIAGADRLNSKDPILLKNTSTVDFGKITKIVLYYDYDRAPADSNVYYEKPGQIPSDNQFTHQYPEFHTPASTDYHIKMIVYSGAGCFDMTDQNITVYASPIVTLSSTGSMCQGSSAVQIVEDKHGFTGTGTFSGPGVTTAGSFDPSRVNPGTIDITYNFVSDRGFTFTTHLQIIVYEKPKIKLASMYTILDGGKVELLPEITIADKCTYRWTPALGLSSDVSANTIASPSQSITYTLTVTSIFGCQATADVYIEVIKRPVIPNTFTPNGDGINDLWDIKYLNTYPNCRVQIYNRYGMNIYSKNGYTEPWDGRYNGENLPAGTYYYIITLGDQENPLSGSITIIR